MPHVVEELEPLLARSVPEPNTGCWLSWGEEIGADLPARAWVRLHGEVPGGMRLRSCGTAECVNPSHLQLEAAR